MEGNIYKGESLLRELYSELDQTTYSVYQTEVLLYLGFIYSNFDEPRAQPELLNDMARLATQFPLIALSYSNTMVRLGKNDVALSVLDSTINNSFRNPYYFLYYKRGNARLRKMDLNAKKDFMFFLEHHNGSGYIKSTYQKLAWIGLLEGDTITYYKEISNSKREGNKVSEEDKAAMEETVTGEIPNVYLLRARLLFDGGDYNKALSEITGRTIHDFPRFRDQLEVTYRLGRIMQKKNLTGRAIEYFEMTLENGLEYPYYFAANSSLLLGMIYEEIKDYEKAAFYYHKCLTIKNIPYKFSIDQRASAGLNRIHSNKSEK
jgi:tetratricopeptide (TPR) repeat protein